MINVYRLKSTGLIYWTEALISESEAKLVACCPFWEGSKSAVRLLSMGEIFDGRMNVNGKLVPLTKEQAREHYKREI